MIPRRPWRGEPPYDRKRVVAAFERAMTVGIAVLPWMDDTIITVSDGLISFDDNWPAIDGLTLKQTRLDDNWGFLFAGTTERVPMLNARARKLIDAIDPASRTVLTISDAVASAYHQTRTEEIIYKYLMVYNIKTMEEFLDKGLLSFGSDKFSDITGKIDTYDFPMELLVYGFGPNGTRHIIEIGNPGFARIRDPLPHWAIGSGTYIALGLLNSRDAVSYPSTGDAVYRACESKFAAETAPIGVGDATNVAIWKPNVGIPEVLIGDDVREIRKIWNRTRNRPVPAQAHAVVRRAIMRLSPNNEN